MQNRKLYKLIILVVCMVKIVIAVAILTLMLSSGFIFSTYDVADDGVKILSDDDYDEMEEQNIQGILNPSTVEGWNSIENNNEVYVSG